ncbi:MAG: helix-turn-helix transcriptional regulator [Methyloceanibacter sp.]|uniref:helix-turn-helix transcriptional regulator n=1 Tax=Methyloceanibacter sp. TaxID=1965321 RepID=UPI003D6C754F
MKQAEKVSALIGDVYDAALDPSLWPGVLRKAAAFVGGSSAALYSKDVSSRTGTVYYDDGSLDPHYTHLYFTTYIKLDPTTTTLLLADIGEPMATRDLIPYDEFLQSRIYKEWVQPQGLVDCVNTLLDKSATSLAVFGVFRDRAHGIADEATRKRARLIVPHVRRAVLVSRVIELKTTAADTFAETLDGLNAGMFLVDAGGRIVHANAAGQALLAAGEVARVVGGRLIAQDSGADGVLQDVFAAASLDDMAVGTSGISVALAARDSSRHLAHVLPLTSGLRRRTGNAQHAVAAVFVHKAALDMSPPSEVIVKTFGLTPTELRVLLTAVEVGSVPSVADTLGISENTVKTHLKRLFRKTGANRQADLVKLMAKFASPLA